MHIFSLSGLVPKLPDDSEGISPIAGLGNGGKYPNWAFFFKLRTREADTSPWGP